MTLKESVVKILKKIQESYDENAFRGTLPYIDIGHSMTDKDKIWWWDNDEMELHVKSVENYHPHTTMPSKDYWGRYDSQKNMVSIAGSCPDIPRDLTRRLRFEFGNNIIIKKFIYEGNVNEGQDDYFISYDDIGHSRSDDRDKLWYWFNDEGKLEIQPSNSYAKRLSHYTDRGDFQGRYDARKNMVSIVDMGSYNSGAGKTRIEDVPQDLIQRLRFEFGDNVKLKTFFEENIIKENWEEEDDDYYTQYGHKNRDKDMIWYWWNAGEEFKVEPTQHGENSHSGFGADFQGRYDAKKHAVSVVSKGDSLHGTRITTMENLPPNLIRRLRFEFGDDIRFKIFYKENIG